MQLRKHVGAPLVGPDVDASMGPQLCSCGNCMTRHKKRWGFPRFNGAATLQLRKHGSQSGTGSERVSLQWGRNFAVAETILFGAASVPVPAASMGPQLCSCGNCTNCHKSKTYHPASMGPQLCSCGNAAASRIRMTGSRLLQWGRNFAVAETADFLAFQPIVNTLQWGRNFAVAETVSHASIIVHLQPLQWGRNFAVAETV